MASTALLHSGRKAQIRVESRSLRSAPGIPYQVVRPVEQDSGKTIVLVHGISREVDSLIEGFKNYAATYGCTLVIPCFDKEKCPDYQRLGRVTKGPRSDLILNRILEEVGDGSIQKIDLFGHSAGAQFAHRYSLFYPERINRLALSAAGWYTYPESQRYPYGVDLDNQLPGLSIDLDQLLGVKQKVFVGRNDTKREASLNQSRRIDKRQGQNRVDRAINWVEFMRSVAEERNIPHSLELELLDDTGHDFTAAVASAAINRRVMSWFMQDAVSE